MSELAYADRLPEVVRRAQELAAELEFENSCLPATGRLLRTLAASIERGVVAELGTGTGVGAAWMASRLCPGVRLLSVESSSDLAQRSATIFSEDPRVRIVNADWREILAESPFQMVFVDVADAKRDRDAVIESVASGGVIVLDDFTAEEFWLDEWRGKPDPLRDAWLTDHRLAATMIGVTRRMHILLATRL